MMKILNLTHFNLLSDGKDDIVNQLENGLEFFDIFLKKIYDKYLNAESIAVEVGGHVGTHTVYLSKLCKWVTVFEPQKYLFYQLCGNLFLNECSNVTAINIPLFNEECEMNMVTPVADYLSFQGKAGIRYVKSQSDINPKDLIMSKKLDSFQFDRLDFIKIDAEFNDYNVAVGGIETIKKHRPMICFEDNAIELHKWQTLLTPHQYSLHTITHENYMAVPIERK